MLSIQEVKKQTGISVRTLRYYDEINLLLPTAKTAGGHRLYGEEELKKLREIQFLKTLHFTLKEIKTILTDENWNWETALQNQLDHVRDEKEKMLQIESTLIGLINSMTLDGEPHINETMKLIQLHEEKSDHRQAFRDYFFASKQEKALLEKLPNINRDDADSLEWFSLLSQLKKHMHQGIESPVIQDIMRQFYKKTFETFGDNEDFFNKFWDIRKSPKKSEQVGLYPIDAEILDFFERAWLHFEANNHHNKD